MPINDLLPDNDIPEDHDPAYHTPYGKLPTDDQPSGDFVNFRRGSHTEEEQNEMAATMLAHALQESFIAQLKRPARLFKKFHEEHEVASKAVAKYEAKAESKRDEREEKNLAWMTDAKQIYANTQHALAIELCLALNDILESIAYDAECNYPAAGKDLARALRNYKAE